MRTYTCYQVDAFTQKKFSGNPAGVVLDATGMQNEEMQQIAREFNNSETAFIFPSQNPDFDVRVRFFTPLSEVPICGHATIAAHFIRAITQKPGHQRVYQKTNAGILPVDIVPEGNSYRIVMTQGAVEFGAILSPDVLSTLYCALGITSADIIPGLPIQIISTGHSKIMVPLRNLSRLHSLQPNMDSLKNISRQTGCNGFYAFTLDPDEDIPVHGRMFAPAIGIPEDPVTGNANGPLGAYLAHYRPKLINHGCLRFLARQGEAIGRSGDILVEITVENDKPQKAQVSGKAVLVFQTEITLPDIPDSVQLR